MSHVLQTCVRVVSLSPVCCRARQPIFACAVRLLWSRLLLVASSRARGMRRKRIRRGRQRRRRAAALRVRGRGVARAQRVPRAPQRAAAHDRPEAHGLGAGVPHGPLSPLNRLASDSIRREQSSRLEL